MTLFAATLLGKIAAGQVAERDPFDVMRSNAGNQITPFESQRGGMDLNPFEPLSGTAYERARYFDQTQHLLVPAAPPALGDTPPAGAGAGFATSQAPEFAREIFYGGYVVAAHLGKLTPRQRERLAAYREARNQLVSEIRTKLDELAGATPSARKAGLAELAARQDSRLRALDEEAEALRGEFAWVKSIFRIRASLPAGPFRLETTDDGAQMEFLNADAGLIDAENLSRMFLAAYFHAGLSTEQRLLLTEIGYGRALTPGGLSLLPATARVPLPADLPPALAEKIRAFTQQKDALKAELRAAILRDDYFLTSTRTRRLTELAGQQAPRFAALEALAEEIRADLTASAAPDQVENPGLPAELIQRIGQFNARKVEARRDLLSRLRRLRVEHSSNRFDIARQGDGLAIVVTDAQAQSIPGLAEFNASQARLYTTLAAESEILRRDVERYLESSPQRGSRSVDQLAGDFVRAYTARANRDLFRDYARAALEPGLSAAHRRLLYHAALIGLDQSAGPAQP